MLSKDFYGKKGFVWWIGVVEDDLDPLMLGSVRARIVGIHNNDVNLVPTENLPWAQLLRPATGSNSFVPPKIGDWVFGFFQDGDYAQIPVVMGVFSGVESEQSRTIYEDVVIKKGGDSAVPQTPWDKVEIGQPTTPRISRGITQGTVVGATNQTRRHVCDISPEVYKFVAYIKAQFNSVLEAIREGIRAILAALGLDPSGIGSYFTQIAKQVIILLQKITKAIRELNNELRILVRIAGIIGAVIKYIESLPERARKFLQECLTKLKAALTRGFIDLFVAPITGITSGVFDSLTRTFNEIERAAKDLVSETGKLLRLPAEIASRIVSPTASDFNFIERRINGYVNARQQTGVIIHNRNVLSSNTIGNVI